MVQFELSEWMLVYPFEVKRRKMVMALSTEWN